MPQTYSSAVDAKKSHSFRAVDENLYVACSTASIAAGAACIQDRYDGQLEIHVTSGRYVNLPATCEASRHRAGVVGTGERAVHVVQITTAAFAYQPQQHSTLNIIHNINDNKTVVLFLIDEYVELF